MRIFNGPYSAGRYQACITRKLKKACHTRKQSRAYLAIEYDRKYSALKLVAGELH